MSHKKLCSRDVAVLGRLCRRPLEIGEFPADSIERLTALGLVRKVLGCCEVTRAGQLTFYRRHFLKASGRRFARVTRRDPVFLHEERFRTPISRSQFADLLKTLRRPSASAGKEMRGAGWFEQLARQTAEAVSSRK